MAALESQVKTLTMLLLPQSQGQNNISEDIIEMNKILDGALNQQIEPSAEELEANALLTGTYDQ